ncbi:MAG: right-handed parallel beta-helix repeat-containing protein, partial [Roseimicrobium sp.]
CQHNVIRQCHIHDMAGGGIYIGLADGFRPKTPEAELTGHNTVDNCFIHNLNHTFHGSVGVLIAQASDNSVTHNDISEFDYTGISAGWTWDRATNTNHRNNRIEKNHIHHLMQGVLSDGGGIYTTGYLNSGTVVRGNVVHDINHHTTHNNSKGIYLDGNSSDIVVENNLCYDISGLGIQTKGERNQIRNNIFAYCGMAGLSRGKQDQEGKFTHEANLYTRNIVYMEHPVMACGDVKPPMSAFDHQLYWNRKNPGKAVFIDGRADGGGARPSDDSDATGRELGQDQSSVAADPGFVNPEQRDLRLKPGSPAEKIGFVPFDFSDAGLYGDPAWTARPAKLTHRPLETVEPDGLAFRYDFEDHHVGMTPMTCWKAVEKDGCTLRISSAQAASGSKSLLFQDGVDVPSYFPNLILERPYGDGRYRLSVKLWQDPADPAELTIGTRSYVAAKYLTGVSMRIEPDGDLFAGKKKLGTVPQGEWITLELTFGSGAMDAVSYDVTAVLANGTRLEATQVPVADAAFQQLNWIAVMASGTKGRFYLDDLELSAGAAIQKTTLPQTK